MLSLIAPIMVARAGSDTPRTIRVVTDDDYAPYSFRSADGKLQGIMIDQWKAWEKKTGIRAEIHAMDWADAVRRMRAGEFDVIDTIVATEERRGYFDFTPAYTTVEVPIFFRNDIAGITDLRSLQGFPVGIKDGDQHADKLRAAGVTTLIPFPSFAAMIEAAGQRRINIFVADGLAARYLLSKAGIATEFRRSPPISRDGLRRAVRRGDGELLRTMTEGFAAIDPKELRRIDLRWYGRTIYQQKNYFTYAAYAAGATLLLIGILITWNSQLRKKVEERTKALSESEERFRQIAENIHEIFWLTTVDLGKMLYVSPGYETVWGRRRESLYLDSRSFIAAILPEDRPRAVESLDKNRAHGFEVEYRIVRPDGAIRWIRDRGFPIKDAAGRTYRVAGIAEDITERKLAEAVVKDAEDRVRLIIDTIPMMAWSVRPDGRLDFLNRRWLDYAGVSMEECVKDPLSVIHPDDVSRVEERWRKSMTEGKPFEDEMRLRRADGTFRWFLVRTAPLWDEQGRIVRWFGSSVDIEDRKQAEEALRQTEGDLRAVLDASPAMIHTARPDGRLDYFNRQWLSFTGRRLEELQGWAWTAIIHPEDRDGEVTQWRASVASGEPFEREVRVRKADGKYRWMLHRKVPVRDDHGNIVRWYGSGTDIEDRKEAERQSRVLVDAIPHQIWSGPPDGTLDYCNERWRAYMGLGLREIQGDGWQSMLHPDDRERVLKAWKEAVSKGTPYEMEERHRGADGTYRWFLSRGIPLLDGEGSIIRWYGTNTDIEDRKQAEEAWRRSEQKLREQEEFYRLLTENTNDLIRMHEPNGQSIYASPSVKRLFGREPAYQSEFAHPDDAEPSRKWFAQVLAGGRQRLIWRVRDQKGNWRWMETQGSLVQHERRSRVMTVCREVTERKEAEEALRGSERQLHSLVGRLNTVREDEAKRIARELHDDLGQKLTALNMELADLERKLAGVAPGHRAQLERMHATVDQTIEAVQELSSELRLGQLDLLGLTAAIDWQLQDFSRRSGIPCVITRLDEITNLADARRTAVFRILQEALTNIVRHAGATRVEVSLQSTPDRLELRVRDNGRGITAAELHDLRAIGLLGMRERAQGAGGTITITGEDGRGTLVLVTVPLDQTGRISP